MIELLIFALGAVCGFSLGAWGAWHFWLEDEKPVVRLTVDNEVLANITQEIVMIWLDQRGMVWQPKGAAFELGKGVKKT